VTPDPLIRIEHVRSCGLCVRGARHWFEQHGLDFGKFLRDGYPASVILETRDHLGVRVVEHARNLNSGI
jgi:hypothetical protein